MTFPGLVRANNLSDVVDRERAWDNLGVNISREVQLPSVQIGDEFGGGYFAGYISHAASGNPTHALIVAPRATGATGVGYPMTTTYTWKTTSTLTTGPTSIFDGRINTDAIITDGITSHPAAEFCANLSIGGFTDWYLPSRAELQIAYFNLKPTATANDTNGPANIYAVPVQSVYTTSYPAQTSLSLFAVGGSEAFSAQEHWSSTQNDATTSNAVSFDNGRMISNRTKSSGRNVRAFRRIAL